MRAVRIIISSEHSGNDIPEKYREAFSKAGKALNSHRGIDFGSAFIAKTLSKELNADLVETFTSRLLVDCNRGLHREDLFSEFSKPLSEQDQKYILDNVYFPHRKAVENYVAQNQEEYMILHLSIHTFTPVWDGIERSVDIGLLYDELRAYETVLCTFWQDELVKLQPSKRILHNSPYTGADDGLTAHLRKIFPNESYMGIEIEVNQKYADTAKMPLICSGLIQSLHSSIKKMNSSVANTKSVKKD